MKIIKEISREDIYQQFGKHRDAQYFAKPERPHKHYYLVALTKDEYLNLLMNSSPTKTYPTLENKPTLTESVKEFLANPDFLKVTNLERRISGTTVAKYVKDFESGEELKDCFITDKNPRMPKNGSYFITDGMHRLSAYGVYKKLQIEDYEVNVTYQTNND